MYDPIKLSEAIISQVIKRVNNDELRAYFRFRRDRWYGGIVTGDVVGCNLRCKFCWAHYFTWKIPRKVRFLNHDEVVSKLVGLANKYHINQARLSGGEPTLGFNHLIKVIEGLISHGIHVVIETNGILIGYNKEYARMLAKFRGDGIEVRVSLKGTSPREFSLLTGAKEEYWWFQVEALRLLIDYGLTPGEEVYPAIMLSFSDDISYKKLKRILSSISRDLVKFIDEEYIIMYDHVRKLLRKCKLNPKKFYYPNNIPKDMI